MSTWYRVQKTNNIQDTFSGEGGLYAAGRWNYRGKKAVYCSQSLALCTLEWLANHGLSVSGFNYYRYSLEVPDQLIVRCTHSELPSDWAKTPPTDSTRHFAEKHLYQANIVAIAVPSVLVPEECNLVINPAHKEFPKLLHSVKCLGQHQAPKRE